ncbi:MAG: hypothetical protein HKN94_03120 [Acidimicrobiales bacterium]|nr:hypothetical protein [Acidimicrobiales bacterium]
MIRTFRLPGLLIVLSLLAGGIVLDNQIDDAEPDAVELVSPGPVIAPASARSTTWFCAAGTSGDGGLADALVTLANSSSNDKVAVVSVFRGGEEASVDNVVDELVVDLPGLTTVSLHPADFAEGSPVVSLAVEVDGGGVVVDKVVSGATGVDRASCSTNGSNVWVVSSGQTTPGARLQMVVFNPFPDDAVVDVEFVTRNGVRTPEDLAALHIPSRSSRLIEIGDVVAAADSISGFVRARSGRVVVEAIQSFDGSGAPLGLSVIAGAPASAESWFFPGVTPGLGPARIVVVNTSDALVRADVEYYPAGAERFIEPFGLTLQPGQNEVVTLNDDRLAGIDSFSLIVRSLDGPRIVAGLEQQPASDEPDAVEQLTETEVAAPTTGFAASPGHPQLTRRSLMVAEVVEGDMGSILQVFNPASDSFAVIDATVFAEGASREVTLEVGPLRTLQVPLSELAVGTFILQLDASTPVVASRQTTGLSSRSWAPAVAAATG